MNRTAKLALEDGTVWIGRGFGAHGEVDGEVCFNTSMTGYQEILTDPSYRGQIVAMTYPEIGNYGVNDEDLEGRRPQLSGFVVRELCRAPSNFRSQGTLDAYLERHNIVGIQAIDTRALVRRLRMAGSMRGVLSTLDPDDDSLVQKAKASPGLIGRDLVSEVMPDSPIAWDEPLSPWTRFRTGGEAAETAVENHPGPDAPHVVALDFGMKWNIARHLFGMGSRVTILPGSATAEEVLAHSPDGVFLSNGPGDPEPVAYARETIGRLLGKTPIFGICLGHQLLALACGAKTYKMKFGHRGVNQPVMDLAVNRVEITTQNHGFAVSADSLPKQLEVTHLNLNDETIEGVRHRGAPAFSVQYHPEASAGPHDSAYLFARFKQMMADCVC